VVLVLVLLVVDLTSTLSRQMLG